jgi:DNA mismatch repair protein MutL
VYNFILALESRGMASIIRLSEETINKIAAGEVVEKPASVVKELVENSVDAGSSQIRIEILGGGYQLIRITDNGSGMSPEDALLSFERHATSKIAQVEDLFSLATMGFRGEAIASIAAVSKMTLLTAANPSLATCIEMEGGRLLYAEPGARAQGTTVEVRSLFYNVPARKKFQKTAPVSSAEITKIVTQLALAHPEVGFELIQQERSIFLTTPSLGISLTDLLVQRSEQLLGGDFRSNAFQLDLSQGPCDFKGIIGSPVHHRHNRSGQFLFVNRRPVICPLISYAIKDAYGTRLPTDRHPIYLLHISLPAHLIDVNVHPQKKEIRLREEKLLKESIQEAVSISLQRAESLIPKMVQKSVPGPCQSPGIEIVREGGSIVEIQSPSLTTQSQELSLRPGNRFLNHFRYKTDEIRSLELLTEKESSDSRWIPESFPLRFQEAREEEPLQLPISMSEITQISPIGILSHYLLLDAAGLKLPGKAFSSGLILVDLRAAEAQVAFDSLLHSASIASQALLIPITLHLSLAEGALIDVHEEELRQFGIDVHACGKNTYLVNAIPPCVELDDTEQLIKELIETLEGSEKKDRRHLARTVSRFARARKKIYMLQEGQELLKQLLRTSSPYLCPQGRPTLIHMSEDEIKAKFFGKISSS